MSSARQRTVGHMNKLIAATAAASACSRPDTQTVTIAPLPTVPASTTTTAPPPPTASATFTQAPQPPPPPDPSGYLVVDMLPAPARCLGVAAASKVTAKFHRDGGQMVLDLVVALPTSGAAAGTKFTGSGASSAWSATIVSSSIRSQSTVANVRLQPTTGSPSIGVQLDVSCGARGNGTLAVTVAYSSPPTESTVPTVTLHDY